MDGMQLRQHLEEPKEHKKIDERKHQAPPRGWSYGQMPAFSSSDPRTEDEYKVHQTGKEDTAQRNSDRYAERGEAAASQ